MKRWLRPAAAVLVGVMLMLALILPAAGSSQIYFMAVNDNLIETTAANMPQVVDHTLYVPYIMLNPPMAQGVDLGLRATYNAGRSTVTVSDGMFSVIFDLQSNTARDQAGTPIAPRAIMRGSMVYLPILWLCDYFSGVRCSLLYTRHGILIRLTNRNAILTEREFVSATDTMLQSNLARYQASLITPSPTPSPSPSPVPTATPAPQPLPHPSVYLGLRSDSGAEAAADRLERWNARALFLFTVEQLPEQDALLRRLVAMGHTVGLILSGETEEECLAQLSEGRRLLSLITRTGVFIVSSPVPLSDQSCVQWSPDHTTLDRLSPTEDNYVELACQDLSAITELLTGDYRLHQVTVPTL